MINFKIKYIPDIFINPNIEIERNFSNYSLKKITPEIERSRTDELWQCTNDIATRSRIKQTTIKERWRAYIYIYENSDISLLECSENVELTVTDENNNEQTWQISEIDAKIIDDKSDLYVVEITFTRDNFGTVSRPFLNTNIEKKIGEPRFRYNRLRVRKNNPTYMQRTTLTFGSYFNPLYGYTFNVYGFKFKNDDLTKNINVGDIFGCHSLNYDITKYIWTGVCLVIEKTPAEITFISAHSEIWDNIGSITDNITIDNIPEISNYLAYTINQKYLQFDVYTTINPKYDIIEKSNENIKLGEGIDKPESVSFSDTIRCLFYFELSELWKYKYLKTADDITFYTADGEAYSCYNNDNIASIKDTDYYNMKEVELNMIISNITLPNI